ncbi:sterol 26-hydroxylase, mitochondrial-like [Lineus longissimus]|uniref:sterol 26-hydroxylase, mitochondrial-like n=1 Tax=Lineus longissimus TaxID=88925 RepID=UPI00315DB9AD
MKRLARPVLNDFRRRSLRHSSKATAEEETDVTECPMHDNRASSHAAGCPVRHDNHDPENTRVPSHNQPIKDFTDIPGPKGLPILGSALDFMVSTRHKILERNRAQYGPIFREKVGPMQSVNLCDPQDVREMYRKEGSFPHRLEVPPWKLYRELKGLPFGIVMGNGPEWQHARSAVNKPMMRPKTLLKYVDELSQIADDLVERARRRRRGNTMVTLDQELFRWSIESVGQVMFETRLGCLASEDKPEIAEFIRSVKTILSPTKLLFVNARIARTLGLPSWTKHEQAWDNIYAIGKQMVEKRTKEISAETKNGVEVEGVLTSLLRNKFSEDPMELNTLVTDLFLGAVDTSPNTMQFALLLLANHPEKQQQLREEVDSVVPAGQPITEEHLQSLPYLKAVFKETLRMYPTVPVYGKVTEEELEIGGYRIPAKTMINVVCCAMGRDPNLFEEPEAFKPERWLKENREEIHPFSSLPFGHGRRSCVGRRIAELQMYLLMTKLMQSFEIEQVADRPIEAKVKLLMFPKTPPRLNFIERNATS